MYAGFFCVCEMTGCKIGIKGSERYYNNAGRSILAAVGDKALAAVPRESRDTVRADIMKQVLILPAGVAGTRAAGKNVSISTHSFQMIGGIDL